MTGLNVTPAARADVLAATASYVEQAGGDVANAFVAEIERTYGLILLHPSAGSPRHGGLLLEGPRFRILRRFPYLVFYVERDGGIDVVRVLHAHRDIDAALSIGS